MPRQRHFLLHGKGPRPSHAPPGSETLQWLMFSMKVEGVLFNGTSILICYHPSIFSSAFIPIGKFFFGVGCVSESVLRLSPRAERPRRCLFGGVLGMFRGSV